MKMNGLAVVEVRLTGAPAAWWFTLKFRHYWEGFLRKKQKDISYMFYGQTKIIGKRRVEHFHTFMIIKAFSSWVGTGKTYC